MRATALDFAQGRQQSNRRVNSPRSDMAVNSLFRPSDWSTALSYHIRGQQPRNLSKFVNSPKEKPMNDLVKEYLSHFKDQESIREDGDYVYFTYHFDPIICSVEECGLPEGTQGMAISPALDESGEARPNTALLHARCPKYATKIVRRALAYNLFDNPRRTDLPEMQVLEGKVYITSIMRAGMDDLQVNREVGAVLGL